MALDRHWFSEVASGYAMSFKIKERVYHEQSPCQLIEVYETENFGYLMVLDGITMLTSRDNFIYHEMMTHPALVFHQRPERVVIVGGGDCGTLTEVLKHDIVERVIQVELDERVTRVAERYFPELCRGLVDSRVRLLFEDAVKWMGDAPSVSCEVIILDTTDPIGQAKRLFGEAFYRDCYRVLSDGGIMVAQSESPFMDMEILVGIIDAMSRAGFENVLPLQFFQPSYPSGWWSATLARKAMPFSELRDGALSTRYYNLGIHRAAGVLPQYLQDRLAARFSTGLLGNIEGRRD